jgi:hypothetical protein
MSMIDRHVYRMKTLCPVISKNSNMQGEFPVRHFVSRSINYNHSPVKFALVISQYGLSCFCVVRLAWSIC